MLWTPISPLNSSTITMKNPEMLKLIILKLKKCVNMQLKITLSIEICS